MQKTYLRFICSRYVPLEVPRLRSVLFIFWFIFATVMAIQQQNAAAHFVQTKKVKEGKKGQKQIATENQGTMVFYRDMMLGASAVYILGMVVFSSFTKTDIFFIIFSVLSHTGCYKFMESMSKAKYSSTGQLVDSGVDLNMPGGVAEMFKDVIILTSACQIFSLYSNYFWLLWLLVPVGLLTMLWKNILHPYFFNQGPESSDPDDKKLQKKKKKKSKWVKCI